MTDMILKKYLTFFGAFIVLGTPWVSNARSLTPYLDEIEKTLTQPTGANLDDFIAALPANLRSHYLMVYRSRSLQSASLTRPRVILHSPDHQFLLAFSDAAGSRPADQNIEMIETYGLEAPHFTKISWSHGRAVMDRDPSECAACHQGAPIFESYPNWPGFYGSSHNGGLYGEQNGTSLLARLEVEETSLQNFIKEAPALPRYQHLLNLEHLTVPAFEIENLLTGGVMISQLQERQNRQVYESLHSLPELHDAYLMSWPFFGTNDGDDGTPKIVTPEITFSVRFKEYLEFIASSIPRYDQAARKSSEANFSEMKNFVDQLGSTVDKLRFSLASVFSYVDGYRPDRLPSPPPRTDIGIPAPDVMIYFDDMDSFRYPGAFYQYWISKHLRSPALPMNNGFLKAPVRNLNGMTFANLLQSEIIGKDEEKGGARNYRDFDELYEWVPLPLKQYTWQELAQDPLLAAAVDGVQKTYLDILKTSPDRKQSKPQAFKAMKSWSPENLKALDSLL